MSRYRYTGPNSSVTLKVSDDKGNLKDQDVIFWNGSEVDLPADHEITAALTAQGYLKPVAAHATLEPKVAVTASGKTKQI